MVRVWAARRGRVFQAYLRTDRREPGPVRPAGSDGLARGRLLPRPGGDVLQQGLADLVLPWFHLSGLPDEGDGGHALAGLIAQHARQGDLRAVMPEVPGDARLPDLGEFGEELRDRLSVAALLPA